MPSMTGTGVLQVLSLKQNFPHLLLGQFKWIYLLELFDGLEILREFICPDSPANNLHLSTMLWITEFILLFMMSPPTNPSGPARNLRSRTNPTPPNHGGATSTKHPPPRRQPLRSLEMVPRPALLIIVKACHQLVLHRTHSLTPSLDATPHQWIRQPLLPQ